MPINTSLTANATSGTCNLGESLPIIEYNLSVVAYQILPTIYFFIGIITRSLCLFAFYKHLKKEKEYIYQIFASLSELLEVITITLLFVTKNNLSGYDLPGALWFQKSYALMWYSAVISSPLANGFITTSLLISVSMAADRLFAIGKPFVYKNINRQRHQLIAIVICIALGLSTSAFDVFRCRTHPKGDIYEIILDDDYVETIAALSLSWVRNIVRIFGNLALIFCNIATIVYYRKNINKTAPNENTQRLTKRIATQKTLLLLTVCQSIFKTIYLTLLNIYYSLAYIDTSFTKCVDIIFGPTLDIVKQITDSFEFFAMLGVSRHFRESILRCLKCKHRSNDKAATTIASNNRR